MKLPIEEFIRCKSIAVVGFSRSGRKFGNSVYTELSARGYQMFAVHPELDEIGGVRCYPNLAALRGRLDGAVVCIPPVRVEGVLRDAAAIGLKNVWLQQGAESRDAVSLAASLGLNLVSGKCILMYAPPVGGFHAWHRSVNRLFGRL